MWHMLMRLWVCRHGCMHAEARARHSMSSSIVIQLSALKQGLPLK